MRLQTLVEGFDYRMKNPSRIAKNLVRAILDKRGLEITRHLPENGPPLPVFRLLLERIITTDGNGLILQIGANDGMVHDPVHEIISNLSLPAILVEPLPDLFERLESQRPPPDWVQGIASFDRSVLTSHNRLLAKPLDNYITSVEVPVITIKQLLERHGNPSIAALQHCSIADRYRGALFCRH